MNQTNSALESVRQAIAVGSEPVRDQARKDRRLDALHNNAQYRSLVPQVQSTLPMTLPNLPVF